MDGVTIQYLVGLYLAATSFSQAESGHASLVKIEFVRLAVGALLVLISIFGVSLLAMF